jgi:hypothetical protein
MDNKLQEMLAESRINSLIRRQEENDRSKEKMLTCFAAIGVVAAIAVIALAVYHFFIADDYEDFDDDEYFDDDDYDFDDDEEPSGAGNEA